MCSLDARDSLGLANVREASTIWSSCASAVSLSEGIVGEADEPCGRVPRRIGDCIDRSLVQYDGFAGSRAIRWHKSLARPSSSSSGSTLRTKPMLRA